MTLKNAFLVTMFGGRTDHSLGGYSKKVYMGRFPPEVQPLTPLALYTTFYRKKYPFRKTSTEKWYPFHLACLEHCNPFNCCNCIAFFKYIYLITKPGSFPALSYISIKCIYFLILLQTEMTDMIFLTLS